MTIHEQAQIELCVALLCASGGVLSFAFAWLVRRRWVRPLFGCWAVLMISMMCGAWALADGEEGKPVPPQVLRWMRMKAQWAQWTNEVKAEWAEIISGIEARFVSVQGLYGDVLAITNSIPADITPPKTMQLRMDTLNNPRNDNFKARPTGLRDNSDGTWTVEVANSREVSDQPTLMMYLRRRSDGAVWWVEHESSSFPSNTSANAYTYTFRMPVEVDGYLAVADEVLLGGPHGLQVEGIVLVDPAAGEMYEGITGDYMFGDRLISIKGGQFKLEAAAMAAAGEEPEALLMTEAAAPMMMRGLAAPAALETKSDAAAAAPVLAMPPLDPATKIGVTE